MGSISTASFPQTCFPPWRSEGDGSYAEVRTGDVDVKARLFDFTAAPLWPLWASKDARVRRPGPLKEAAPEFMCCVSSCFSRLVSVILFTCFLSSLPRVYCLCLSLSLLFLLLCALLSVSQLIKVNFSVLHFWPRPALLFQCSSNKAE